MQPTCRPVAPVRPPQSDVADLGRYVRPNSAQVRPSPRRSEVNAERIAFSRPLSQSCYKVREMRRMLVLGRLEPVGPIRRLLPPGPAAIPSTKHA
jgi:hypothetical protein